MPGAKNECFPSLNNITSENRAKLEERFGFHIPEQQDVLPGIDVKDGELVVPNLQIQTELLPEGKEIYFAWDPRDGVSIFTTSEDEVGLGVMLPLNDLHFDKHGGPLNISLTGYITNLISVKFEGSHCEFCQFILREKYSYPLFLEETREIMQNGKQVYFVEFRNSHAFNGDLGEIEEAMGFDLKKIYVSNMIGYIIDKKLYKNSTPAACVLMYLG